MHKMVNFEKQNKYLYYNKYIQQFHLIDICQSPTKVYLDQWRKTGKISSRVDILAWTV